MWWIQWCTPKKNAHRKKLWLNNCYKINVLQTIAVVQKRIIYRIKSKFDYKHTRARTQTHTNTHSCGDAREKMKLLWQWMNENKKRQRLQTIFKKVKMMTKSTLPIKLCVWPFVWKRSRLWAMRIAFFFILFFPFQLWAIHPYIHSTRCSVSFRIFFLTLNRSLILCDLVFIIGYPLYAHLLTWHSFEFTIYIFRSIWVELCKF